MLPACGLWSEGKQIEGSDLVTLQQLMTLKITLEPRKVYNLLSPNNGQKYMPRTNALSSWDNVHHLVIEFQYACRLSHSRFGYLKMDSNAVARQHTPSKSIVVYRFAVYLVHSIPFSRKYVFFSWYRFPSDTAITICYAMRWLFVFDQRFCFVYIPTNIFFCSESVPDISIDGDQVMTDAMPRYSCCLWENRTQTHTVNSAQWIQPCYNEKCFISIVYFWNSNDKHVCYVCSRYVQMPTHNTQYRAHNIHTHFVDRRSYAICSIGLVRGMSMTCEFE